MYGHRTAYGAPFADVVDLASGDSIVNGRPERWAHRALHRRTGRARHRRRRDPELPIAIRIEYLCW